MADDRFYMPAKVFGGEDIVRRHAADLGKLGHRALIVTGKHSALKCGVYDDICAALDSVGAEHCWFNEIEENPSVATVMKARDFALTQGADYVIGAGGGSPMDAAKAAALMIKHPDKDADYLYTSGADGCAVPVVCVPTTCGTGSEVTAVSVLSNDRLRTKKSIPFKIFPDLSLIDGKYLIGAGRGVLCNTGFDALAHLIESYINSSAVPTSRMVAADGMRLWRKNLPVLAGKKEMTADNAQELMRASMLGGMAIAHTGTSLPHGLSYSLTYHLGIPHGKAVFLFMKGYLDAACQTDRTEVLELTGFRNTDDLQETYRSLCGGPGVENDLLRDVLDMAVDELSSDPGKCAKAPFAVNREILERIAYGAGS